MVIKSFSNLILGSSWYMSLHNPFQVEPEDAQRWPPRGCGAALISSHGRLTAKVGILSDATQGNYLEVSTVQICTMCYMLNELVEQEMCLVL